jgi:agmatine deiminase
MKNPSRTVTPRDLGYRMPAEWEPHEATWIAWPHERADWPEKFVPIPWVYGEVVRHLVDGERVRVLVDDERLRRRATRVLSRLGVDIGRLDFIDLPTDRVWTRDYGPLYVRGPGGDIAVTNWRFNGWAKYPNHRRDDAVCDRLAALQGRAQWRPMRAGRRVVLEGGSIDTNGAGTVLTTEECLLSPVQARNPMLSKADLEEVLGDHLGVRKVLWLGQGIAGDDTHGHVDDLARFVDPRTVVVAQQEDPADPDFAPLADARRRLRSMTNADGEPLRVVPLPMPRPVFLDGQRLPASYANFYIGNRKLLVPTFNDPADRVALETLARLFPTRIVVGIHAVDLVWGLGTLHCMTLQEPAGYPAVDGAIVGLRS